MLKKICGNKVEMPCVEIKDAKFPVPFKTGLEYSAPARGTWNIVHTGMLIPEAHEIFVCAAGCLRGVVLTAAEMGASERFSTIEIREDNLLDGTMEDLILCGVREIIGKLKKRPRAILLYTSCIHHFVGCDTDAVFSELRAEFPDIDFTDCYMNPIMRKSGLTPDELMRRQLYSLIKPKNQNDNFINIVGNDLKTDASCEIFEVINSCGKKCMEITDCVNYEEYLDMAKAALNITYYPPAKAAGQELERRMGQRHLYLPQSFDYEEIRREINMLCEAVGAKKIDCDKKIIECKARLAKLLDTVRDTKIVIDYTAVSRPFGLAKLLSDSGFNVSAVFADTISGEDRSAFEALKLSKPDIMIHPTVHPSMRMTNKYNSEKVLAIGQKAAYFTGTQNFVNIVEGGGHWGYDGIIRLADEAEDAYMNKRDTKKLIQVKGWGCGCC